MHPSNACRGAQENAPDLSCFLPDPGLLPDPEPPVDYEAEARAAVRVAGFYRGAHIEPDRPPPAPPDPARPFAGLEERTAWFRKTLSRHHRDIARASTDSYRDLVDAWDPLEGVEPVLRGERPDEPVTMADLVARATWHTRRAGGQITRFDRVRGCGDRVVIASCSSCGESREPRPECCGVTRVCPRCSLLGAKSRRARFGRARALVLYRSMRMGLTRKYRSGGRFTEKMLTLTVPHVKRSECTGRVAAEARDDTHARIVALFAAWPIFLRFLNRAWKARGETGLVKYTRGFEWTPGADAIGHPHFHVYLWCPFIPARGKGADNLVKAWWAYALRKVGVPVREKDGDDEVIVRLQLVRDFNASAVEELIKGGRRRAIELSRLDVHGGGDDAYDYADGWTIGEVLDFCNPDVTSRLYMALEGRRLSQASRGFYEDDPPLECECCGSPFFRVRFEPNPVDGEPPATHERGPP